MAEVGFITRTSIDRINQEGAKKISGMKSSSPIGIYDSGVGGLTVLKEAFKQLPNENIIYLADTARVPYGGRLPAEIIKINHEIIKFLLQQKVKYIIMACGTSSALALESVKKNYKVPIIGMIKPGAAAAIKTSRNKKIGVIATVGTAQSHAFQKAIIKEDKKAKVYEAGCPLFVPLIEGGFIDSEETKKVIKNYTDPLVEKDIDTLVLGCTHYPHLSQAIQEVVGTKIKLVDPAMAVIKEAKNELAKLGLLADKRQKPSYNYYTTSQPLQFQEVGSRLLGKQIGSVKNVRIKS